MVNTSSPGVFADGSTTTMPLGPKNVGSAGPTLNDSVWSLPSVWPNSSSRPPETVTVYLVCALVAPHTVT